MTYIIAEIGINHNGDIDIAKKLIDMAKKSGCDAVKFQKRDIESVYDKELLDSPRESPWGKTTRDQKLGLEFEKPQYDEIDSYCKEVDIEWFGSAWDIKSLEFLDNYNLNHLDLWANNLSELDLRNGNNQNMSYFVSWNSQNLICISVDDSFFSANNWTSIDPWTYFSESCSNITSVIEHTESKELLKVKDLFGRETNQTNQLLFYIYDDGTVEKKVIIE